MQIVIDIPEKLYERFGHEYREENLISKSTNDAILEAFCNGTPLPKGHGRLIDADAFKHKVCTYQQTGCGNCKDCRWWKDSDGVFRRGIGAESQCPMNRIEVYEGNGYCYMFEPQESEGNNG